MLRLVIKSGVMPLLLAGALMGTGATVRPTQTQAFVEGRRHTLPAPTPTTLRRQAQFRAFHDTTTGLAATNKASDLQSAQRQFIQALQQSGAIGTSESNVQGAWSDYVRSLVSFAGTSQAWLMGPRPLTTLLNRGSAPINFEVSDTGAGNSRVRTILVSDHKAYGGYGPFICVGPPERYPLYAVQVMVTTSPRGSTQTELMGQIVNERPTNEYTSFPSVYDAFDSTYAWTTPDQVRHMAAIAHTICGGSGGDFPRLIGLRQSPGQRFWTYDPTMFPGDLDKSPLLFERLRFVSPTGSVIRMDGAFESTVVSECNGCFHVFGYRFLTRIGLVYHAGPWHLIPSPYLTLVQALAAAKNAQQGGVNECSPDTLSGLVASNRAGQTFCAVMWQSVGVVSVVKGPDNLLPPYKPGATVLSVDNQLGNQDTTYLITMTPVAGAWVISDTRRK